jgi:hypothetical protein
MSYYTKLQEKKLESRTSVPSATSAAENYPGDPKE